MSWPPEEHPLRVLRRERCLSQTLLSSLSGVGVRTLVAIENFEQCPRTTTRRKLLNALNLDITEHLGMFGPLPD